MIIINYQHYQRVVLRGLNPYASKFGSIYKTHPVSLINIVQVDLFLEAIFVVHTHNFKILPISIFPF